MPRSGCPGRAAAEPWLDWGPTAWGWWQPACALMAELSAHLQASCELQQRSNYCITHDAASRPAVVSAKRPAFAATALQVKACSEQPSTCPGCRRSDTLQSCHIQLSGPSGLVGLPPTAASSPAGIAGGCAAGFAAAVSACGSGPDCCDAVQELGAACLQELEGASTGSTQIAA